MRYIPALFTAAVLFVCAALPLRAETDEMMRAAEAQVEAAVKNLERDFSIRLAYEVVPHNQLTLNDVFGFIAKLEDALSGDEGKEWADRIKKLGGLSLFFRNTETKDVFIVTEIDANASIQYNRREMTIPELLEALCSERQNYLVLSEMADKMKVRLKMGEGISWRRASVFIRSLREYAKKPKYRRVLKAFVIVVEKQDMIAPDYEKREVHVPVSMTGERLMERLADHMKEYAAWKFCRKVMSELAKMSIVVRLDDKFRSHVPISFWRSVKEVLSVLNRLAKNPKFKVIMASRPIVITDEAPGRKEDAYYLSIHSPDTVEEVLGE